MKHFCFGLTGCCLSSSSATTPNGDHRREMDGHGIHCVCVSIVCECFFVLQRLYLCHEFTLFCRLARPIHLLMSLCSLLKNRNALATTKLMRSCISTIRHLVSSESSRGINCISPNGNWLLLKLICVSVVRHMHLPSSIERIVCEISSVFGLLIVSFLTVSIECVDRTVYFQANWRNPICSWMKITRNSAQTRVNQR